MSRGWNRSFTQEMLACPMPPQAEMKVSKARMGLCEVIAKMNRPNLAKEPRNSQPFVSTWSILLDLLLSIMITHGPEPCNIEASGQSTIKQLGR